MFRTKTVDTALLARCITRWKADIAELADREARCRDLCSEGRYDVPRPKDTPREEWYARRHQHFRELDEEIVSVRDFDSRYVRAGPVKRNPLIEMQGRFTDCYDTMPAYRAAMHRQRQPEDTTLPLLRDLAAAQENATSPP